MSVRQTSLYAIQEAHAQGMTDRDIAYYAGISPSTVRRGRKELGLETHCPSALLGKRGELLVNQAAQQHGLHVQQREVDNAPYDFTIAGLRVDVKSTRIRPDGSLSFRCPKNRASFYGQYTYSKNIAEDCDVVALAGVTDTQRLGYLYLLPSELMPTNLTIKPGGEFDQHLDNWSLFGTQPLQA